MWYACSFAINYFDEDKVISNPISLGCGIYLEPAPEWVKHEDAIKYLSWNNRKDIEDTSIVFSTRYEAEALGSPDPSWKGKTAKGIQSVVEEKFMLSSLALWLVKPSRLSCNTFIHFSTENDPNSNRSSGKLNSISVDQNDLDNCLTSENISDASIIFETIMTINRDGSLWSAIRMLIIALDQHIWEIRYLLLWVAIEALFGTENTQETTYRLSQRAAFFVEDTNENRKTKFTQIKKAYGIRSQTVHGLRLSKLTPVRSTENMNCTEAMIRHSMIKILTSGELINIFNTKKREEYLDALVFS